jgi:hypothetical protein
MAEKGENDHMHTRVHKEDFFFSFVSLGQSELSHCLDLHEVFEPFNVVTDLGFRPPYDGMCIFVRSGDYSIYRSFHVDGRNSWFSYNRADSL